jgi:hypothetical protein
VAKNFAELLHAAMKIDANRAVGKAGAGGDFGASHPFDEAKDQWFTVGVREGADGVEDRVRFGAGVGGMIRGWSGGVGLRGVRLFVEFFGGFCATMKIRGAIAGDGGEPSGEARDFAESGEARQSQEKDVLHEIVCVGEGNSGEENPVNHAGVAGVQKAERGAVTLLRGAYEGVVGTGGIVDGGHGRGTGAGCAEF